MSNVIQEVKNLISENRTQDALDILSEFFKTKEQDLHHECILYKARINKISQDFRVGLVDYSSLLNLFNQINYSVLTLLKEAEKLMSKGSVIYEEPTIKIPKSIIDNQYNIFVSYSHHDMDFKLRLDVHLSAFRGFKNVKTWTDQEILPGQSWEKEINKSLVESNIFLALISADYLSSEWCMKEMEIAIGRHVSEQSVIVPIILRPCHWQDTVFAKIQALPLNGKPITAWQSQDEAFANVVEGIRRIILK